MSSEASKHRSDAADVAGEVRPGDIVTSRAPLEMRDQRQPRRAAESAPTPPRQRPRPPSLPEWVYFAVLAAIFIAFGSAIMLDKDSREPRALASTPLFIGELHPNITDVNEDAPQDGALEITLAQASPMYPASVMAEFANDALVVLRRMHEFFPQVKNRTVRFVAKAPLNPTDPESKGLAPILAIEFDRNEVLARIDEPAFTFQDLLNQTLAVHYLNELSGPRYLGAFCRDPLSRSAADFCNRNGRGGE